MRVHCLNHCLSYGCFIISATSDKHCKSHKTKSDIQWPANVPAPQSRCLCWQTSGGLSSWHGTIHTQNNTECKYWCCGHLLTATHFTSILQCLHAFSSAHVKHPTTVMVLQQFPKVSIHTEIFRKHSQVCGNYPKIGLLKYKTNSQGVCDCVFVSTCVWVQSSHGFKVRIFVSVLFGLRAKC